MAFRSLASMAYDPSEQYDRMAPDSAPPDYPQGLCLCVSREDLERIGAEEGEPGDVLHFAAMGEVTSIFKGMKDCRVELQVGELAGEDGKFFDLSEPAYMSLCGPELEKMDLEADCERGDLIHLVGVARMESSVSTEMGDRVHLQVTELGYVEDESSETREHMRG